MTSIFYPWGRLGFTTKKGMVFSLFQFFLIFPYIFPYIQLKEVNYLFKLIYQSSKTMINFYLSVNYNNFLLHFLKLLHINP